MSWPFFLDNETAAAATIQSTAVAASSSAETTLFDDVVLVTAAHEVDSFDHLTAYVLLPLLCLIGFVGNLMVCIAIASDRRLHNVTNYFLFSLALADLLVCSLVMPLAIIAEYGKGVWTFPLCLVYTYADVFLCSASIVHMSVISLDRYLGISKPLKTRNRSLIVVGLKITFVWVMTTIISSPLAVLAVHDASNVLQNGTCGIANRYYMIYGSVLAFLIPFIIMAVTYVKTTKLLNKQANELAQRANDRFYNGLRRTMTVKPQRKMGYVRQDSYTRSRICNAHKNSTLTFLSATPPEETKPAELPAQFEAVNGRTAGTPDTQDGTEMENTQSCAASEPDRPIRKIRRQVSTKLERQSESLRIQIKKMGSRTTSVLLSIAGRGSSIYSSSAELASEHKATRVLAVVFMCFFICWTPFFLINFLVGFCGYSCSVPAWTNSLFLWLGYTSSTLNPVIYTVFNRRFRQAFLRIIQGQCCWNDSNSSRNVTSYIASDIHTGSYVERSGAWITKDSLTSTLNGRAYTPPVGQLSPAPATRTLSVPSGPDRRIERSAWNRESSLDENLRVRGPKLTVHSMGHTTGNAFSEAEELRASSDDEGAREDDTVRSEYPMLCHNADSSNLARSEV